MDNTLAWLRAFSQEVEEHERQYREWVKTQQLLNAACRTVQCIPFSLDIDTQNVFHTTVWGQVGTGMSSVCFQENEEEQCSGEKK